MSYHLGIDLGTTYTAAAIMRDGRARIVELGTRSAAVPSVVFLRDDETILTGDSANRRALSDPGRVAREFKRRIGDTTPILVGGSPLSAEALMSKLLRWVYDTVSEREGGPPESMAVSHPANWGPYKTDLLKQAVRIADLGDATLLTEPEAAAIHYASQERVESGTTIAIYDLGGGTFDAAVLRKSADGWEVLGDPEGIERLGGIDFDAAVFAHVSRALEGKLEELDPDDTNAQSAVARLREECVEAKEALSGDTDVSIPVLLPNISTEVRLTRTEFEAMIRPSLNDSIDAMRRALRSAGVEPDQVSVVLLVGGSSRIPLVAQMLGSELGAPVAVDVHPKNAIASGAARAAAGLNGGEAAAPPVTEPVPAETPASGAAVAAAGGAVAGAAVTAAATGSPKAPTPPTPDPNATTMVPPQADPAPAPAPPAAAPPQEAAATVPLPQDPAPPAEPAPRAPAAATPPQQPPPTQPPASVPPAAPPAGAPPVVGPGKGESAPGDGGGGPSGGGGNSRTLLIIGLAVLIAVVLGAVAVVALSGGNDNGGETAGSTPDVTTEVTGPGATTAPSTPDPTAVFDPAAGCDRTTQICITDVGVTDGALDAGYETDIPLALPGVNHAHFYLSPSVNAVTSGAQGGSGPWSIWASPGRFAADNQGAGDGEPILVSSIGANDKLCVTVANDDHSNRPETEQCFDLSLVDGL